MKLFKKIASAIIRKVFRQTKKLLYVWKPTGYTENNIFRFIWKISTSPIFLIFGAVITIAAQIYFNLIHIRWIWIIAPSAIGLAILIIAIRRVMKGKLLISKRQAKQCNKFYDEISYHEEYFKGHVGSATEQTKADKKISNEFYCSLGEAFITLEIFEETKRYKINTFSGKEYQYVKPVEFHTDFISEPGKGIVKGYVLIRFSQLLIPKMSKIDERVIYCSLQDAGYSGWSVEQVSNYNTMLFILKNESVSNAYDFSGVN